MPAIDTAPMRFLAQSYGGGLRWVKDFDVQTVTPRWTRVPHEAACFADGEHVRFLARHFGAQLLTYEQALDASGGDVFLPRPTKEKHR